MDQHNENTFTSGIRPPTNIRSPKKLFEMSAAATNARSMAMPPPGNVLKRKTLADRAGETSRPAPAAPSRPLRSLAGSAPLTGTCEVSHSSSISSTSRPTSMFSSRSASNSSHSSSVGPGSRLPSASSYRPQSSMGHPRLQRSTNSQARPATSLDLHHEELGGTRKGSREKRMVPNFSCLQSPSPDVLSPKSRRGGSLQLRGKNKQKGHAQDIFVSKQLDALSLNGREKHPLSDLERLTPKKKIYEHIPKARTEQPAPVADACCPQTPSHIPKRPPLAASFLEHSSPPKSLSKYPKKPCELPLFLNRQTNTRLAWDTDSRLDELENQHVRFKEEIGRATSQSNTLHETIQVYKLRITELETSRTQLIANNSTLQIELDSTKARLAASTEAMEDSKRYHKTYIEDLDRQNCRKLDDAQHEALTESRRLLREQSDRFDETRRALEFSLESAELDHQKKIREMQAEGHLTQKEAEMETEKQREALCSLRVELEKSKQDVLDGQNSNNDLQTKVAEIDRTKSDLETSVQRLESHIKFLESDNKSQSHAFADLEMRMQNAIKSALEATEKLIKEETLRRKLHNQVQELKGNIRVFCRARPALPSDFTDAAAKINFPDEDADCKEIEITGLEEKSSLGSITTKRNSFSFDRVFGPNSQNGEIFNEISQLVQSALDGYNVCIFCYGQTGSGKTFTMSSSDGMIPRAVYQIYDTTKALEEKGWKYNMEGSFIEVYNETLNDLLGKVEEIDKKKHEIKHDLQKGKTTITNIETVELDSPKKVETILSRASSNRSVAATQANERSSRSHSVFILKLIGENTITGEKSEGTLNLVDLAGSERLGHSQATGERLKETQNINKSLSCLGDVIGALGQGREGTHVPYRNSKLTYLLQNSLGGNSKTLMFVMISPLQDHLSDTLTSLKFATKVHNTHIGTAKRQSKT